LRRRQNQETVLVVIAMAGIADPPYSAAPRSHAVPPPAAYAAAAYAADHHQQQPQQQQQQQFVYDHGGVPQYAVDPAAYGYPADPSAAAGAYNHAKPAGDYDLHPPNFINQSDHVPSFAVNCLISLYAWFAVVDLRRRFFDHHQSFTIIDLPILIILDRIDHDHQSFIIIQSQFIIVIPQSSSSIY
jgi:hypothetical protein